MKKDAKRQLDRRELEELNARFEIITEKLDDVFSENGPDGLFSYVSPNIERLLGLTPEDLVGRRFDEFVHPDDLETLTAGITPTGDAASGRRTFRLRGGDGRWHWVESRGRAYRLPSGEVRFVGMTREVTETREAERRFRMLGSHGHDLITEFDGAGRFEYVSPNVERLLGYRAELLRGRAAMELVHPDDVTGVEEYLESLQTGVPTGFSLRTRRADGAWCWMETVGARYLGTNGEPRILSISRNISDRVEAQEALIAARARAEELARRLERSRERERAEIARDVHDELGQGLTGLQLGLTSLLTEGDLAPPTREYIRRIAEEAGRLTGSLQRIATRLWPAALELGLAEAIEAQARELASAAGWTLELDLDDEGLVPDREREATVFRIAQEALTNAARHAAANRVEVSLRVHKDELHLEVRDDGVGIAGGSTRTGRLGIAGMRERALAWGGRLVIDGSSERGTRVRLDLPLSSGQDAGQ